jgi:carboxyl-terminal processing protease
MRTMKAAIVMLMVSLACGDISVAAAESSPAQHSNYAQLFDAVWSTVNVHFYDPRFRGVNWNAVGAQYRRKLAGVTNDQQFKSLATHMLDELGTSHLYVEPPNSSKAAGVGIGVRFRTIGGETLVSTMDPLSYAHDKGLRPGDHLLSPLSALYGTPGTSAVLKFQSCAGKSRTLVIKRVGAFWPPQHPGFAWRSIELSPGHRIGYIKINRFDDGAAELADSAMSELKDTDALIIDVRDNSGGNLSATRLASYFMSGPPRIEVALFSRPYLEMLGHAVTAADVAAAPKVTGAYTTDAIRVAVADHHGGAVFMTEDMGERRYTKPVVVLIGRNTGSAAEGFAWVMRDFTKATLVGRKTAGALLSGETFDLPYGWKITVPVQGLWGPDGTDYRDRAVSPKVTVAWTRRDLCSDRDPDIAKAIKLLTSSSTSGGTH